MTIIGRSGFRPYTGNIGHATECLSHAAGLLRREAGELERRLWSEDLAGKHVTDSLPELREAIAIAMKAVKDMEDTLTTVEQEMEDAA